MNEEISKHILKTGTLTIGLVCKDGLVVAADKRQSYGAQGGGVSYIAGKAKKIEELNERMIATTAGNASDTRKTLDLIKAELKLKELKTNTLVSVKEAANFLHNVVYHNIRTPSMIPNIGHFIFAGYDDEGLHLFDISPDGYIQKIEDYTATGSGIMQAHPILDTEYNKNMTVDQGIKLAKKCIEATTRREPGVGTGMNVYVIKPGEVTEILDIEAKTQFGDEK